MEAHLASIDGAQRVMSSTIILMCRLLQGSPRLAQSQSYNSVQELETAMSRAVVASKASAVMMDH